MDSVTQLSSAATTPVHCLCYLSYKTMPKLQTGLTAGITDAMWTRALQNTLVDMGRAQKADATGVYDLTTASQVRQFQRDNNLEATGVVDVDTWQSLQLQGCRLYDLPSTKASP